MYPWFLQAVGARLVRSSGLLLCALVLASGCSSSKSKPPDFTEITGTVLFKGQPLPGGQVKFVAVAGGWTGTGVIDGKGHYKLSAPLGDVKIAVSNDSLKQLGGKKGPAGPAAKPMLKRPGSEDPIADKGHYVPIPDKYSDPEKSGLTYKVEKGATPHEIRLE
jgi:hypothetical protein